MQSADSPVKELIDILPVLTFLITLCGVLYGVSLLRVALSAFTDGLAAVVAELKDVEHRLTVMEAVYSVRPPQLGKRG